MRGRQIEIDIGAQHRARVARRIDPLGALAGIGEHRPDRLFHQRVLRREMGIESAVGQPGARHDPRDRDIVGPLRADLFRRFFQHPVARFCLVAT
jgi:hypothetical protein